MTRTLRSRLVAGALTAALLVLAAVALAVGDYRLSLGQVLAGLGGSAGFDSVVVLEWRLPRVTACVAFGAALGLAGALFQTITRNPLGSPDIIGFASGAYTGVIVATTVLGGTLATATGGALVGGLATALVIYLLAYRDGVQGFRLIIVGVGVTAMLHAVNAWLLLRAQVEVAMSAAIWGNGSLSLAGWPDVGPALGVLAAALPLVAAANRPLRQLELGDDAAAAHGVRVEPARLAIIGLGILLTAVVTAATGPIAFVALAAPQIARRLAAAPGIPLTHAALTGSFVLLGADLIAQHLPPNPVPVGVVTVVLGGAYLLSLLVREARRP
ncbi:iron chelate uptake ABC transporter family permease subunit [Streptomyces sp. DSM 44915]|uniref:Iron chelate uptake ABC transporter family permease subunit n=1 Tax=Streptomyces chisholmiae TaxID=3075540 RepID=A0ABU2JU68_9ACTN|nr:iron chelate uptake ABC transporter family permease subunit [Streptomyces sp. DSM 44915]MDT0268517.1 iron chelate uptake ABC transporter family permease subunit [Streptomyces sp. DSM 44915]